MPLMGENHPSEPGFTFVGHTKGEDHYKGPKGPFGSMTTLPASELAEIPVVTVVVEISEDAPADEEE